MAFKKLTGMSYEAWMAHRTFTIAAGNASYRKPFTRKRIARARLHMSPELWDYLEELLALHGRLVRRAWHVLQSPEFKGGAFGKANLNTLLQGEFSVSKRTANSAINDAEGLIKAAKEKQMLDVANIERKIEVLERRLDELRESVNERKKEAIRNKLDDKELARYRRDKENIHQKSQKSSGCAP